MTNTPTPGACATLMARLLVSGRTDVVRVEKARKRLLEARDQTKAAAATLSRCIKQFAEHLENARTTANWVYGDQASGHVSFDDACGAVNRDPEALSERIFSGLSPNLLRLVMQGKDWNCPLCNSSG